MQSAAQSRFWTNQEFEHIRTVLDGLGGSAPNLWDSAAAKERDQLMAWVNGFLHFQPNHLGSTPKRKNRIVWSQDELTLALDIYLRFPQKAFGNRDPEILELSSFLNRMGKVLGADKGSHFRNPNGVAMKLMNFRRCDPIFQKTGTTGLTRGNKLEGEVWNEYSGNPDKLREVVTALRAVVENPGNFEDLSGPDEPGMEDAPEGNLLTRVHRSRERNKKLVDEVKKRALKTHGKLSCSACGFEFSKAYGAKYAHIIDCHHTKPVHTLADGSRTNIRDLVLLCSNCHRVIHSRRQWLTVAELMVRLGNSRQP